MTGLDLERVRKTVLDLGGTSWKRPSLVAGLLGDWVLPFVYNIGLQGFKVSVLGWMFLGGLVALEAGVRPQVYPQIEVTSDR